MKKQHNINITCKQTGLTLVELMVAMIISLLLIGGTITIFVSNKQTYRINEASSRVQENGRFAFNFIKPDVRMAGFMGCLNPSSSSFYNNVDVAKYDSVVGDTAISSAINGFIGGNSVNGYSYGTGTLPSELTGLGLTSGTSTEDVVPNTDIIVIKRAEDCNGNKLVDPKTNANFKIETNANCNIQQNQILFVSNCLRADLFAATDVTGGANPTLKTKNTINENDNISASYGPESEVYIFQTIIFYIGQGASGEPSLFKRSLELNPAGTQVVFDNQELVEGVSDMAINYGVDSDGDGSADYYVDASTVPGSEWDNVISLRVRLDAQSTQVNVTQNNAANQNRLTHTFTETIRIRNR